MAAARAEYGPSGPTDEGAGTLSGAKDEEPLPGGAGAGWKQPRPRAETATTASTTASPALTLGSSTDPVSVSANSPYACCLDSPLSTPATLVGLSPLMVPASPALGPSGGQWGTHAWEVKAMRLKATKNQMRAGVRGEGNLLFVDLLHWVQDVEEVPMHRLIAYVEDLSLPQVCRPAMWGLPCPGCALSHGLQLRLWRGRSASGKSPPWMRSPPYLPGLVEMPLEEVAELWASAPDERKAAMGGKVQFVTYDGVVIWGRDLGEDSGQALRAFLADMQAGVAEAQDFALPPAAADVAPGAVACTVEAWQGVLAFLPTRDVARAAVALLSGHDARSSIGDAWAPHALLGAAWPPGARGLRPFLQAARSGHLAELVFAHLPRADPTRHPCQPVPEQPEERPPLLGGGAPAMYGAPRPRTVALPARPSALALSGGDRAWEGLLAIASGREIKLIRRYDLGSCGTLTLRDRREVGLMRLSPGSRVLAVVPADVAGPLASEIHFYSTEDKMVPVVAGCRQGGALSGLDFLPGGAGAPGGVPGDVVATCGARLLQVCPQRGDILASWEADADALERQAFVACRAASPSEVVTAAGRAVELWDLRTAHGMVRAFDMETPATALDIGPVTAGPPLAYAGDAAGGLFALDWRAGASAGPRAVWSPPRSWGRSPPVHTLLLERGCACVLAGPSLALLALQPSPVLLGWADVRGRLSAVAAGPGAWALAAQAPSARSAKSTVVLVESWSAPCVDKGELQVGVAKKPVKMYRKSEMRGEGQHARGAGKGSRSGFRGR